jgi:hypothetical protein
MKFYSLFFIFLSCLNLISQESKPVTNSNGLRFNKNDFFLESGLNFQYNKLNHEFGLGFGINKTIFQSRFSPEVFYVLKTNFKSQNKFNFQGLSSYHLNLFNVNRNDKEIHFFNELLVGFQLSYGEKYKVYIQPEAGIILESFHSDFYKKVENHLAFNYSAKIGFIYYVR